MYAYNDLAFLASPKAGSTSLKYTLPKMGFRKHPETNHHESKLIPGIRYFCLVRNHWDAITSWCFFAERIKGPPFELKNIKEFVLWHPQYFGGWPHFEGFRKDKTALWRWVGTDYDPIVLRYEDFPQCVVDFLESEGFEVPKIPHYNKSEERNGKKATEALNPDTIQWIWDRWGEEIEELGYTLET